MIIVPLAILSTIVQVASKQIHWFPNLHVIVKLWASNASLENQEVLLYSSRCSNTFDKLTTWTEPESVPKFIPQMLQIGLLLLLVVPHSI